MRAHDLARCLMDAPADWDVVLDTQTSSHDSAGVLLVLALDTLTQRVHIIPSEMIHYPSELVN